MTAPYFVLGGFGIDAADLVDLRARIARVAKSFDFPMRYPYEIKFGNVGKNKDDAKKPNWMVRAGLQMVQQRRALALSCLNELAEIDSVRAIAVAVDRKEAYGQLVQRATESLLERINWDCRERGSTACLVFCDQEEANEEGLRHVTRNGSSYMRFDRILDTISFMPSTDTVGIQMADLVAGAVSRYLNAGDPGFLRVIWPSLRRNENTGAVIGYGLKFYPSGSCEPPPPQVEPWPEFDRVVSEYQARALGLRLDWTSDGTPDIYA
jgi:hypothetical protein